MTKTTYKRTQTRRRKYGEGTGYAKCKNCGGDGVVRIRNNSKKRKK